MPKRCRSMKAARIYESQSERNNSSETCRHEVLSTEDGTSLGSSLALAQSAALALVLDFGHSTATAGETDQSSSLGTGVAAL